MAGVGKSVVNHTGETVGEAKQFLLKSTMHKWLRGKGVDDDYPSLEDLKRPQMERPSQVRKDKSEEDLSPLACPFVKFDPLKHEKCLQFVLKDVSRVKQHLVRVHSIPAHCPKCYTVFRNNVEARDKHVREGICQTAPELHLEGIDEPTMRKLKRRVPSRSVTESWYSMFALLFPEARKPQSPFMDTTLSAELLAFRDFCTYEGYERVTSVIGASMLSGSGQQQDQFEVFTRQVIEELFLQWQSRFVPVTSEPVVDTQVMLPPTPPSTISQPTIYAASLSADETYSSEPCFSKTIPVKVEVGFRSDSNASLRQMAENKCHSSTGTETLSPGQLAQLHRKTSDVMSSEGRSLSPMEEPQLLQPVYKQLHVNATTPGQSRYENVSVPCGGTSGSTLNAADQSQAPEPLEHSETIYNKLVENGGGDPGCKQLADRSNSQVSRVSSDTDSVSSSEESMDDVDGIFLDQEVSRLRSWLLGRIKSEHFCQHLQNRLTYGGCESSTLQEQPTNSTPKPTSLPTASSFTSSSTTATSCGSSSGGKRGHCNQDGQDEQQHKKRRLTQDVSECKPAPRLACLFNKYDPMMYRSNSQTYKKFEICGMHDFQNMNKLYEHLKRVHSDQPLQCPRCTRTSFGSSEELQAHQTASEPCTLIPLDVVKRIQWVTHDKRIALQSAISRRLRGCTDEEKWTFAYRWLFPDTNPDDTPCPYLRDPVISIVSSATDDYEMRLREMIRQCRDFSDLESRLPMIRGQFLAQYGISTNEVELEPSLFSSLGTVSSTGSERPLAETPQNVAEPHRSNPETVIHQDQLLLSSTLPTESLHQPPTSAPADNHGSPSRMTVSLTPDVTQTRYHPTQAATALLYQPTGYGGQNSFYQADSSVPSLIVPSNVDWIQEGDFAWAALDVDTNLPRDIVGSKGDMPEDFMANNEFGTGSWVG